jgi:hypothetical protein
MTWSQSEHSDADRRREAVERMRGMFSHVAPDPSLVDELIAERRAEARTEDREDVARQKLTAETLDAIPALESAPKKGLAQSERDEGTPLEKDEGTPLDKLA